MWDTYINVQEINELQDRDWVTVTKELGEMSLPARNHTDKVSLIYLQLMVTAALG